MAAVAISTLRRRRTAKPPIQAKNRAGRVEPPARWPAIHPRGSSESAAGMAVSDPSRQSRTPAAANSPKARTGPTGESENDRNPTAVVAAA